MVSESNSLVEHKYQSSLETALDALADVSPDRGENRPDWENTPIYNVLTRARDIAGNVIRHPVTWLGVTTFGFNPNFIEQVATQQGGLYEMALNLNNAISQVPLGQEVLRGLQTFSTGPFPFNTNALIGPDRPPIVNLLLALGSAAQVGFVAGVPLSIGLEKLESTRRSGRMLAGIEPLRSNEKPKSVMIGPSELLSTVAKTSLALQTDKKRPNVIVHADNIVPTAFGNDVTYHFDLSKSPESVTKPEFHKKSGMDRAENLIFAAFDEDNALFYGRDASSDITPSMISTIISYVSQKGAADLQGKNIVVVVPKDVTFLTQTTAQHNLFELLKQKVANIELITPEDVILRKIQEDVNLVAADRQKGVDICLVGGKDTQMLVRFQKAVKDLDPRINVHIISDEILDDVKGERAIDMPEIDRVSKIEALLQQSDLNYVYGDTDPQTTDLANLIINTRQAERTQTVVLLEREEAVADAKASGLFNVCVYQELAKAITQKIAR